MAVASLAASGADVLDSLSYDHGVTGPTAGMSLCYSFSHSLDPRATLLQSVPDEMQTLALAQDSAIVQQLLEICHARTGGM